MTKQGPKLSTSDDTKIEETVEEAAPDPYVARRDATLEAFTKAKKVMPTAANYVRASMDIRHTLASAGFDNSDMDCIFAICRSQAVFDQIQLINRLQMETPDEPGEPNPDPDPTLPS